jgi:signal transduction histidine kinase
MSAPVLASVVVALLVALFNLLVAGHALVTVRGVRGKLAVFLASSGIGVVAVTWFISLMAVDPWPAMRVVEGWAGLLSVTGFLLDAVGDLEGSRRRRGVLVVVVLATGGLAAWGGTLGGATMVPRVAGIGFLTALAGVRLGRWRASKLDRDAGLAILLACGAYGISLVTTLAAGAVARDPNLVVVLAAQCLVLVYVLNRRVDADILLARGITYALFSVVLALVAAWVFARLGYAVDLVQVSVTVGVALVAAVLFMGLADATTRGVSRLFFPHQARLESMLAASRGEAAALRRRLEQVERLALAGELAASVAHEVKNPLAAVRGYAQLLASSVKYVDEVHRADVDKAVRIIVEESDRVDARVGDLLGLCRARSHAAAAGDTVDVNRVVADVVAVAEGEPGAAVVGRMEPGLPRARGRADEVRAAVSNLLRNAREASQESGETVEVSTRREGELVVVEIVDGGVGLTEEQAARLFRPFHTTKPGGTGLGLCIARSAVEAVGGRVTLAPRPGRRGAVARVELSPA